MTAPVLTADELAAVDDRARLALLQIDPAEPHGCDELHVLANDSSRLLAHIAAQAEEIARLTALASPDVIPCPDCGFKFFACYMETHRRKDCDQRERR